MADLAKSPSGVQELIGRLRDDGVKAGRTEAAKVVQEAHAQAAEIVRKAKAEAESLQSQAKAQIETERKAAHEAIRMAFRDTRMTLASAVKAAFAEHVGRLVSTTMEDREFIKRVLLALFGRAVQGVGKDQPVEVALPADLFAPSADGVKLTDAGKQQLRQMVLGLSGEMLREGVKLVPSAEQSAGMTVRLVGHDLEIDLRDEALSELLMRYLLPRYRAILQGVD
jgi:V/A-type H+/Na+-transporting ATPase subunit E